jgi:ATP-dependent DNA helicase RecG
MFTLDTLNGWLLAPSETEHLEFKEAKNQYDTDKLLRYCVALANEGGGYLVLGVSDKAPRQVVGSQAFLALNELNQIKMRITDKLRIRVDTVELQHPSGRVLVFVVPARAMGQAFDFDGAYLMRSGESLVPMTPDRLRAVFAEGKPDWLSEAAMKNVDAAQVVDLLDTQSYFELLKQPYPTTQTGVMERFAHEGLISGTATGWTITNLAAILFAKRLSSFPLSVARKATRFIIYEGTNKTITRTEQKGERGYAVIFEALVDFVHASAPRNRFIEQAIREETKMFPKQALRELIANALVHQDFTETGTSVMIEMYQDRIEISNPGLPPIQVNRFIDENRSRNECLTDLMRRFGICEEKGSGIDKVIALAELYQLPAPDFRVDTQRTIAVLFSHQDYATMSKSDRIRACYQHCCLMRVSNQKMSNPSLRERFGVSEAKVATVSLTISATKDAKLIKVDESETTSTRYARYLPYWA